MTDDIEHLLREIASNNRSGAAEILARAAELFELLAGHVADATTVSQARRDTMEACVALVRAQPCMSPMINLASAVILATATSATMAASATSASDVLKAAAGAAAEFTERCRHASATAAANAAGLIRDGARILTHSRSSTILSALVAAHNAGTRLAVIATESRPLLEGRTLAEELINKGLSVTLIADAAAASAIETATCILVGADRVTPLVVANKIGTRLIALAAAEQRVPAYAVADSSKFISAPDPRVFMEAGRPPDELWPNAPAGVLVLNRYFEETYLRHFTGIITEDGILAPEDARRRAEVAVISPSLAAALNVTEEHH